MTAEVTNLALAMGAEGAVLMASPMGAPVYRRMGFTDVGPSSASLRPAREGCPGGAATLTLASVFATERELV